MRKQAEEKFSAIQQNEDDLDRNRPIYHLLHFEDVTNALAFRSEVVNNGYVVTSGDVDGDIIVLHILPLHLVKVMAHAYYLADCAKKYQGTYVDWQVNQ